jgi:hypothetical protein
LLITVIYIDAFHLLISELIWKLFHLKVIINGMDVIIILLIQIILFSLYTLLYSLLLIQHPKLKNLKSLSLFELFLLKIINSFIHLEDIRIGIKVVQDILF